MPDRIRQLLEARKQGAYNKNLAGVHGTYRFDIHDAGHWRALVDDGRVTIEESTEPAECVIESDEEDIIQILEGRQNLVTAAMQGRVQVSGNLALAQKFHGMVGAKSEEQAQSSRRKS